MMWRALGTVPMSHPSLWGGCGCPEPRPPEQVCSQLGEVTRLSPASPSSTLAPPYPGARPSV